jgi:hypothetical protein
MGDKAKPRWLLGVISRPGNTYKILDISFSVFTAIRKYAKNVQHFGDPTKYDIIVEVDKNGGAAGYYSVQALSKEPLSAADQVIKDEVNATGLDDLKRRVTPPTPEKVQERMDKIDGIAPTTTAAPAAKKIASRPAPKAVTAPAVSMTDDEELDKLFPSHEGDAAQS